ncbi:hypothetical protein [Aquimarina addita]
MNTRIIIKIICVCVMVIPDINAQDMNSFIDHIKKEAAEIKNNKIEYEKYKKKEDSLFRIRELDIQKGMHAFYRPDLKEINAPLGYYYNRLVETSDRCKYYLEAISVSEDIKNRQQFILYLQSQKETICEGNVSHEHIDWNYYIAVSANAEWANQYIASQPLSEIPDRYTKGISYLVIQHWADELFPENKMKAFSFIEKIHAGGPSNQDEANIFRVLYRLKPKETQANLLKYWNKDKQAYNFHITTLLPEFNTVNLPAAKTLLKIRAEYDATDMYTLKQMNTALFFMNPKLGEEEMITNLTKENLGEQSLEDVYSDVQRVLASFCLNLTESKDKLALLLEYIVSDPIDTFGDVPRYTVLKILYKKHPSLVKKALTALKEKSKGTFNTILQWVKNNPLEPID